MNDRGHRDPAHIEREQLALLLYGELSFDEEELIESHLDHCAECREALIKERTLHRSIDQAEVTPSPSLLFECREDLRARLIAEQNAPKPVPSGWWDRLVDAVTLSSSGGILRPAGALTMIAIGLIVGRALPRGTSGESAFTAMGMAEASRVRNIEPTADGRVQIVLDETRQRMISGAVDDDRIRTLLLSAAKDSDPGLRAETVELFTTRAQTEEFRDALISAVEHDQNAGVRMKALEGLRPFVAQQAVRSALAQVLLTDANPGLRTQAIDLLIGTDNRNVDRQMIGTLQEVMEHGEQLGYVRERCRRVLESMNASIETY